MAYSPIGCKYYYYNNDTSRPICKNKNNKNIFSCFGVTTQCCKYFNKSSYCKFFKEQEMGLPPGPDEKI